MELSHECLWSRANPQLALCGHIRAKLRALTFNASFGVIASYALENASKPRLRAALIDIDTVNRPPTFRPITIFPHSIEHLGIFLPVGLAFGISGPTRFLFWLVALNLYVLAVELLQLWVPGRHARVSDFIVDAVALNLGLGIGLVIARTTSHCSRPSDASRVPIFIRLAIVDYRDFRFLYLDLSSCLRRGMKWGRVSSFPRLRLGTTALRTDASA